LNRDRLFGGNEKKSYYLYVYSNDNPVFFSLIEMTDFCKLK
jgi:hypothetical protein